MIERVVSYRAEGCEGEGEREDGGTRYPGVSVELEKKGDDRAQLALQVDVVRRHTVNTLHAASCTDWQSICRALCNHAPCMCVRVQVLLSKDYARFRGYQTMEQAVTGFRESTKSK